MNEIIKQFTPLTSITSELVVSSEVSNETKYPVLKVEVDDQQKFSASLSSSIKHALSQANITGDEIEGKALELSYAAAVSTAINLGSTIMDITAPAYLAQKLNNEEDIVKLSLTFRSQPIEGDNNGNGGVNNRRGIVRGIKGNQVAKTTAEVTVSISEISETSVNIFTTSCEIREIIGNIMKYNAYKVLSESGKAKELYLQLLTYYEAKGIMYNNDAVQENPSAANVHLQAVIAAPRLSERTLDLSIYAALAILNPTDPKGFFLSSFFQNSETKRYKSINIGNGSEIITKKYQAYMYQSRIPVVGVSEEEIKQLSIKLREMDIAVATSLAIDEIRYSEGHNPEEISYDEAGLYESMIEVKKGLLSIEGSSKNDLLNLLQITEADEIVARGQAASLASQALESFIDATKLNTSL